MNELVKAATQPPSCANLYTLSRTRTVTVVHCEKQTPICAPRTARRSAVAAVAATFLE